MVESTMSDSPSESRKPHYETVVEEPETSLGFCATPDASCIVDSTIVLVAFASSFA